MLQHQGLAIVQTEHQPAGAGVSWPTETMRLPSGSGRLARQQRTVAQAEETRLAVLAQTQGDLVLLFDGQQQRLARIGQPGRLLSLAGLQLGALEHRQHDLRQIEEDQGDGAQHGQAADGNVPARQVVFQRAYAPLALQCRRVEVQPLHIGIRGHVVHVVHARLLGRAALRGA